MNQPPFLGKDRLSTLVICQDGIPVKKSSHAGDEIGGSKEQHSIVTHGDNTRFQCIPLVLSVVLE